MFVPNQPVRFRGVVAVLALVVLASACRSTAETSSVAPTHQAPSQTAAPHTVAVEPTPTVLAAGSRDEHLATGQPTVEQAEVLGTDVSSIRDIDFYNGFAYDVGRGQEADYGRAVVLNGEIQKGEFGDPEYYWFGVTGIRYGDLDGDGIEEAVVATALNGGGTGTFESLNAFRLVDGTAELAGSFFSGDRAYGGIMAYDIEDGAVRLWSFSNGRGSCCPTEVSENRLLLGSRSLVAAEVAGPLAYVHLSRLPEVAELRFLPGTSAAWLLVDNDDVTAMFTVDAAAGQRLWLDFPVGTFAPEVKVTHVVSGTQMSGLEPVTLPDDGLYEIVVDLGAGGRADSIAFRVVIDGDESRVGPAWSAQVDQVIVDEELEVISTVAWPVFESDAPGVDAVNTALADFASELAAPWIEGVSVLSEPQGESTYEALYTVAFASSRLVSVEFSFYDYVCCQAYPNYGQHSIVFDLELGQVVPIEEMIDESTDEVRGIWLANLLQTYEFEEGAFDVNSAIFSSVSLHDGGLRFGTNRGELSGPLPSTSTFVSFAQLDGLIKPSFLELVAKR